MTGPARSPLADTSTPTCTSLPRPRYHEQRVIHDNSLTGLYPGVIKNSGVVLWHLFRGVHNIWAVECLEEISNTHPFEVAIEMVRVLSRDGVKRIACNV